MWIAITSKGTKLSAEVDHRFGRCRYFILYELETGNFKTRKNPYAISLKRAGIQVAKKVTEEDVKVVLTGHVGPNAFETLSSAGIKVYTNISGKVSDAVLQFIGGMLTSSSVHSVKEYFGLRIQEENSADNH